MHLLPEKKQLLGDYHVGKTIGQGAFSKVKLGFHKSSNVKVAIKIIDKKMLAEKAALAAKEKVEKEQRNRKKGVAVKEEVVVPEPQVNPNVPSFVADLQLEVQLLLRLGHPNIIRLYQVMETQDETFVIMEYATGM